MESDFGRSGFWRKRGRIENPHDALEDIHYYRFMNVQTGFEFGFASGQFPGVRSSAALDWFPEDGVRVFRVFRGSPSSP
jgi:hypothetical protein